MKMPDELAKRNPRGLNDLSLNPLVSSAYLAWLTPVYWRWRDTFRTLDWIQIRQTLQKFEATIQLSEKREHTLLKG